MAPIELKVEADGHTLTGPEISSATNGVIVLYPETPQERLESASRFYGRRVYRAEYLPGPVAAEGPED